MIRRYGDLTYSLHTNEFTFFVETIIGQMLSSKAADAITARMYSICNGALTVDAILKLEPRILKSIGISGLKSEYILHLAETIRNNPLFFSDLKDASDKEIICRLTTLHGIGAWSAKMYLIFVLDRPDVLPYEDGAFLQAYKWLYGTTEIKPSLIEKRCEPWSPHASLAARYLYRALDEGLTKDKLLEKTIREFGEN